MPDSNNPLLVLTATGSTALPDFASLSPDHAEPAVDQLIGMAREAIDAALAHAEAPTWETLIAPIEDSQDAIDRAFSPIAHMHAPPPL